MNKKSIVVIIMMIIVVTLGFSFVPMLKSYQLSSFENANEKYIGEGQKFVDASGKRCLLSDTIAGDKCPSSSRGYNSDTGKYDMGTSGTAQIYKGEYGYESWEVPLP